MSKPSAGSKHHEGDGCQPYPGTENRDPAEDDTSQDTTTASS